jgi:hypothetical protein
VYSDSDT